MTVVQPTSYSTWKVFLIVACSICVALLLFWTVLSLVVGGDYTKSGPWGDSFAPLNTLFSGLAFAAICTSLVMQRQELALQREELALTREELRNSVNAQKRLAEAAEHDDALRTRPRVILALVLRRSILKLAVRNDGQTSARNLRLMLNKPVPSYGTGEGVSTSNLNDLALFSRAGHSLTPSAEIGYLIRHPKSADEWREMRFTATATYEDVSGTPFTEDFHLSGDMLLGASLDADPLRTIVDQLTQTNTALRDIARAQQAAKSAGR